MAALLASSLPRRGLNAGWGSSRRSSAMRSSSVSSGSGAGKGARGSARIASSAWSSRSFRPRLLMDVPHAGPQALEGPELQLLHGAFALAELLADLAKALLLDESPDDDAPLVPGKTAHELG